LTSLNVHSALSHVELYCGYFTMIQESKIEIVQLHECVADYKNENADLASQLTLSLEAREAAAKQKARYMFYVVVDIFHDA
jgi:hypothetical protein